MLTKIIQFFSIILIIFLIDLNMGEGQLYNQPNPQSRHDYPEVPRITAFEAMDLYKEGKLILANAHESEGFARRHIIGSISLPNGKVQNMNIRLPENFIIAFYCQ